MEASKILERGTTNGTNGRLRTRKKIPFWAELHWHGRRFKQYIIPLLPDLKRYFKFLIRIIHSKDYCRKEGQ